MLLDASLLNTQHYKVCIKGKHPPLHLSVVAIEKEAFGSPSTTVAKFALYIASSNYFYLTLVICLNTVI